MSNYTSLFKDRDISIEYQQLIDILNNSDGMKLDLNLNSSQLIDLLLKLDVICPKQKYWDGVWTIISIKDISIELPPKGKVFDHLSTEEKREIFFYHIKQAEKLGRLSELISFMNKLKPDNFFFKSVISL